MHGVDARHQSLRCRFLVTRRAVRLSRREESANLLEHETRQKLQRIDAVILDRVAGAHDARLLQARNRMQESLLHIDGKARRHALHIDFLCMPSFRLQEELVAILVGEAKDLRLDGRTIARTDPFDDTICHRRPIDVRTNDLMRLLVRVRQIAWKLLARPFLRHKGKALRLLVPRLQLHLRIVKGTCIKTRRRPRLEAHDLDTILSKRARQFPCGSLPIRPAARRMLTDDDAPFEIRARRENDSTREIRFPRLCHYASRLFILDEDLFCQKLPDFQPFLLLAALLHAKLIGFLILLRAQSMDSRAFSRIQKTILQSRLIGIDRHGAAKRIDLTHEMALCGAADRGIAGHECDIVQGKRRQKRAAAEIRCSERRFDARMPRTEDDDIIFTGNKQRRPPHLPTQKRENISSNTSSPTVSPVISPSFSKEERRSMEMKSSPSP